jgi:hypothetical protein
VGTVDGPHAAATHRRQLPHAPTPGGGGWCAVNDRRRKTDKPPISISTNDAWFHYAKLRFPDEKVWGITERDRWLINHYRNPAQTGNDEDSFYAVVDGSVTSIGRAYAPKKLEGEVDRAYYRYSVQQEIDAWFEAKGFDLSQPTIPKHLFEAAVQAEFGQSAKAEQPPPEPTKALEKYKRYPEDDALVVEAVEDIKSKKFANAWQAAQALASRAKGSPAKVHRLHKKILQSRKTSKHRETNKKI